MTSSVLFPFSSIRDCCLRDAVFWYAVLYVSICFVMLYVINEPFLGGIYLLVILRNAIVTS